MFSLALHSFYVEKPQKHTTAEVDARGTGNVVSLYFKSQ